MGNWGEITPTSRGAIFTQVMTGTPPPGEPLKKTAGYFPIYMVV